MNNDVANDATRREFLRAVPAVAAAGFVIADGSLFAARAAAEDAPKFQLFRAQQIGDDMKALEASPGNKNLVQEKTFTVALTAEKAKNSGEYEWHEMRDHLLQILEGETEYELGGTPKGAHAIAPGDWRAPSVEGAAKVTLRKGDWLAIPRGTIHRRNTVDSVTFALISPQGS
jgi:quercetin dioxygenase-like cupin family protein